MTVKRFNYLERIGLMNIRWYAVIERICWWSGGGVRVEMLRC